MTDFLDCLKRHPVILAEAAICERLRRMDGIDLHPTLFNAPLIYSEESAAKMTAIYDQYIEIARQRDIPILVAAPTWRLDAENVQAANVPSSINVDAVEFIKRVRAQAGYEPVYIAGLLAAKNDSYDHQLALQPDEAEVFHRHQADQLADAGVDCLIAQTIPSVREAEGMARAMLATGVPSIMGFCINRHGEVLDGTPLDQAMALLDERLDARLLGFMVNCSHPDFVRAESISPASLERLIGISANASSKDHCVLESAAETVVDSVDQWADAMVSLHRKSGLKILGGCCGTDDQHLRAMTQRL